MSSLDYPEDFENNNPFAEPVISDQVNGVHSQTENNETQLPESHGPSGEPSPDPNSESILTEDESKKAYSRKIHNQIQFKHPASEIEKINQEPLNNEKNA